MFTAQQNDKISGDRLVMLPSLLMSQYILQTTTSVPPKNVFLNNSELSLSFH
jgi:hypothetical protein